MSSDHPRVTSDPPSQANHPPPAPSSLSRPSISSSLVPTAASRLAASATSLTRSIFNSTSSPGVASGVLSAVGNSEKGAASSSGSGPASVGDEVWAQGIGVANSSGIAAQGGGREEGFRDYAKPDRGPGWEDVDVRGEIAGFEGDDRLRLEDVNITEGLLTGTHGITTKGKGKEKVLETISHQPVVQYTDDISTLHNDAPTDNHPWTREFRTETEDLRYVSPSGPPTSHTIFPSQSDVVKAELTDGHGVVSLLNQSNFSNSDDDTAAIAQEFADADLPSADDLFRNPNEIPTSDAEVVRKYKTIFPLTAPPQYTPVAQSNPLGLWPDLETLAQGAEVLLGGSEEEKRAWIGAWEDVARNYVEDVWGEGVCPWVAEARGAIREMGEKGDGEKGEREVEDEERKEKALARLRMVLGHMKSGRDSIE